MKWIKLTEAQPEILEEVLIFCMLHGMKPDIMTAYIDREGEWCATYLAYCAQKINTDFVEITHWMPLPDYPK